MKYSAKLLCSNTTRAIHHSVYVVSAGTPGFIKNIFMIVFGNLKPLTFYPKCQPRLKANACDHYCYDRYFRLGRFSLSFNVCSITN